MLRHADGNGNLRAMCYVGKFKVINTNDRIILISYFGQKAES